MRTKMYGELEVSAIGLGCMTMSDTYGPADQDEAQATLLRAVELGVTLFDTANVYGRGANEELVGRVLAPHRAAVLISTKFGFTGHGIDGTPEQVAARCDESLGRLGTDYIDLYLLHRPDPNVPIEDTVGAMAALVEAGKVRYIGLSEVSADTLRRANAAYPISALQSEYSLWTRDPESGVLDVCQELGIGFMPYSPLGRAMLTGDLANPEQVSDKKDFRAGLPRFQAENFDKNRDLVQRYVTLAESVGVAPAQLALAWVMGRGENIAPIPGTRRRKWLEQNVGALDVSIDESTLAELDELFDAGNVAGARYGEDRARGQDTPPKA